MKKILGWMCCCCSLSGLTLAAPDKAALKAELVQIEADFCAMAQAQGLPAAFAHYAAEDAVFFDVDPKLHRGREAVRLRYADAPAGAVLTWKPVQVDVADSGELGYTWGTYVFRGPPGPDGNSRVGTGHYVTIWKRQADGAWRFVLDTGNPNPPARK